MQTVLQEDKVLNEEGCRKQRETVFGQALGSGIQEAGQEQSRVLGERSGEEESGGKADLEQCQLAASESPGEGQSEKDADLAVEETGDSAEILPGVKGVYKNAIMSEKGELTATRVLKREEKAAVVEGAEGSEQPNKLAAQAMIVRRRDGMEPEILLGLRAKEPMMGEWFVFGGKKEQDETMRQCACREVEEEVGLALKEERFEEVEKYDGDQGGNWKLWDFVVLLECREANTLRLEADREHLLKRWCTLEEVKQMEPKGDRLEMRIEAALAKLGMGQSATGTPHGIGCGVFGIGTTSVRVGLQAGAVCISMGQHTCVAEEPEVERKEKMSKERRQLVSLRQISHRQAVNLASKRLGGSKAMEHKQSRDEVMRQAHQAMQDVQDQYTDALYESVEVSGDQQVKLRRDKFKEMPATTPLQLKKFQASIKMAELCMGFTAAVSKAARDTGHACTVLGAEIDCEARKELRRALPEIRIYDDCLHIKASHYERADVQVVHASFPCSPWSRAGSGEGRKDPQGRLLEPVLDELQSAYDGGGMPVIIIENVHGFKTAMGGQSLKEGLSQLMPGYYVSVADLHAEKTPSPLNGVKAKIHKHHLWVVLANRLDFAAPIDVSVGEDEEAEENAADVMDTDRDREPAYYKMPKIDLENLDWRRREHEGVVTEALIYEAPRQQDKGRDRLSAGTGGFPSRVVNPYEGLLPSALTGQFCGWTRDKIAGRELVRAFTPREVAAALRCRDLGPKLLDVTNAASRRALAMAVPQNTADWVVCKVLEAYTAQRQGGSAERRFLDRKERILARGGRTGRRGSMVARRWQAQVRAYIQRARYAQQVGEQQCAVARGWQARVRSYIQQSRYVQQKAAVEVLQVHCARAAQQQRYSVSKAAAVMMQARVRARLACARWALQEKRPSVQLGFVGVQAQRVYGWCKGRLSQAAEYSPRNVLQEWRDDWWDEMCHIIPRCYHGEQEEKEGSVLQVGYEQCGETKEVPATAHVTRVDTHASIRSGESGLCTENDDLDQLARGHEDVAQDNNLADEETLPEQSDVEAEVVDDEMTEWNEGVLVRMSRRGKEFVPQVYLSQDAEGRLGCALQDRYRVMPPVVKVKLCKKEVDAVEALTDMKRLAVEMQWTGNSGETKESIRLWGAVIKGDVEIEDEEVDSNRVWIDAEKALGSEMLWSCKSQAARMQRTAWEAIRWGKKVRRLPFSEHIMDKLGRWAKAREGEMRGGVKRPDWALEAETTEGVIVPAGALVPVKVRFVDEQGSPCALRAIPEEEMYQGCSHYLIEPTAEQQARGQLVVHAGRAKPGMKHIAAHVRNVGKVPVKIRAGTTLCEVVAPIKSEGTTEHRMLRPQYLKEIRKKSGSRACVREFKHSSELPELGSWAGKRVIYNDVGEVANEEEQREIRHKLAVKAPEEVMMVLAAKELDEGWLEQGYKVQELEKQEKENYFCRETLTEQGKRIVRDVEDDPEQVWLIRKEGQWPEIIDGIEIGLLQTDEANKVENRRTVLRQMIRDNTGDEFNKLEDKEKDKLVAAFEPYLEYLDPENIGRVDWLKAKIDTGNAQPIRLQPYRLAPKEREVIRAEVAKMLKLGVIRPSRSPWGARPVLVAKPDGSQRFCIDFRELNKLTKFDAMPIPRIDDTLAALAGSKYFSQMDANSGFWQQELEEADREKTSFITPDGQFEFNTQPFGLINASSNFQRLMNTVLGGLTWQSVIVYIDDVLHIFADGG